MSRTWVPTRYQQKSGGSEKCKRCPAVEESMTAGNAKIQARKNAGHWRPVLRAGPMVVGVGTGLNKPQSFWGQIRPEVWGKKPRIYFCPNNRKIIHVSVSILNAFRKRFV